MPDRQASSPRILWHYTVREHLDKILEESCIRLASCNLRGKERPCAWFTRSDSWEETANKAMAVCWRGQLVVVDLDRELTHRLSGGLVRIGVLPEAAPHDWKAYRELSRVPAKIAKAMYETAVRRGSHLSNWFVSFEPVPRSKWVCIEYWDGNQWCDDPGVRPPVFSSDEAEHLINEALITRAPPSLDPGRSANGDVRIEMQLGGELVKVNASGGCSWVVCCRRL